MNITRNGYLSTEAAAARLEQQIKDWLIQHVDPREKNRARRALSNSRAIGGFERQGLHIMTGRISRHPLRRCASHYVTHKNRDGSGYCYQAALHIFTLEESHVSGIIGNLYVTDSAAEELPWRAENLIEDFENIFRQAERERYQALDLAENQDADGRSVIPGMPGLYLMISSGDNHRQEDLPALQERVNRARVTLLNERDIMAAAGQVDDAHLRRWLTEEYRLIAVRESGEKAITFPQEDELSAAVDEQADGLQEYDGAQAVCAIIRNLIIVTAMASRDPDRDVLDEIDPATRMLLSGNGMTIPPYSSPAPHGEQEPEPPADQESAPVLKERIHELDARMLTQERLLEERERELEDTRAQVANLQEALRYAGGAGAPGKDQGGAEEGGQDKSPEKDGRHSEGQRANLVLEAITDPHRFPHLRFLAAAQEVSSYGKRRPHGQEIIAALSAINSLAGRYYAEKGKIGSWEEHLRLPGWTYSPRDSATTMGKHQEERTFTDHETRSRVVIDRHLTYNIGTYGGMQIYFDKDDDTGKFIVAYIGGHKTVAHQTT